MIKKFIPLISLFTLLNGISFAQENKLDSLRDVLHSDKVNALTFEQLIAIQKQYANEDKELTIAFGEVLLARKDFMSIDGLKAEAFFEIGYNYRNYGDSEKAKYYIENSLSLFKKLNKTGRQTDATNLLAVYYANIDEDSLAIKLYTETIRLAQSISDTLRWISPYKGLSSLFAKIGLNDKCITYCEEGLVLAKKINHAPSIAALYNNMAIGYYQKKEFAPCIKFLKEALSINKKEKMYEATIRNLSNIGSVYQEKGNIAEAARYAEEAESLLSKINVPRTSIYTFIELAKLRNLQKNYVDAVIYAQKAIKLGKEAKLESISAGAYTSLVDSYKALRKPEKALEALENYWLLNEKFLEAERNKSIAGIEQEFLDYKKEKEIEIQKSEIALLKKDQTLGKTQRNGAAILASLLGVVAFLYYNRFRLKKKSAEQLKVKNEEIEKQSEVIQTSLTEKETLLREIHHRVKNNLQIISSLLNIQSNSIDDPLVLSSIKEGQSRVQAMSLIHQNLYQSEHINNVDIENYLKELVVYLSEMFHSDKKEIEVEVKANQIEFDIDTAIPLGLIVNELVSNAYKYAFEKKDKGKINIGIKALNQVDYELEVNDDGDGLPDDFNPEETKSLGLKLVKILSKQLRGKFFSESKNGTSFKVLFKDVRAYQTSQE